MVEERDGERKKEKERDRERKMETERKKEYGIDSVSRIRVMVLPPVRVIIHVHACDMMIMAILPFFLNSEADEDHDFVFEEFVRLRVTGVDEGPTNETDA